MKVFDSLLCNLAIAARHLAVVGWAVKSKQPVRSSKVTQAGKSLLLQRSHLNSGVDSQAELASGLVYAHDCACRVPKQTQSPQVCTHLHRHVHSVDSVSNKAHNAVDSRLHR